MFLHAKSPIRLTVILALVHYGLYWTVSGLSAPTGDPDILREPINLLCSPSEQDSGQQSHTSWRLSRRRLQLHGTRHSLRGR